MPAPLVSSSGKPGDFCDAAPAVFRYARAAMPRTAQKRAPRRRASVTYPIPRPATAAPAIRYPGHAGRCTFVRAACSLKVSARFAASSRRIERSFFFCSRVGSAAASSTRACSCACRSSSEGADIPAGSSPERRSMASFSEQSNDSYCCSSLVNDAFCAEISSRCFWYRSTLCRAGRDVSNESSVSVVHRGSMDFKRAENAFSKTLRSAFISGREVQSASRRGSVFSSVLIRSCSLNTCSSMVIFSASETSSPRRLVRSLSLSSACRISASAISS